METLNNARNDDGNDADNGDDGNDGNDADNGDNDDDDMFPADNDNMFATDDDSYDGFAVAKVHRTTLRHAHNAFKDSSLQRCASTHDAGKNDDDDATTATDTATDKDMTGKMKL
jgi:hypothetical protein